MDYEQKYKEAFERAKDFHLRLDEQFQKEVEKIFPELKESEEEKMRKKCIELIKELETFCMRDGQKECIAWLEKQGVQKEWNKEDNDKISTIIAWVKDYPRLAKFGEESFVKAKKYADWLKSLRPQWKPSVAQLTALSIVSKGNAPDDIEAIVSLYNDLKKLTE